MVEVIYREHSVVTPSGQAAAGDLLVADQVTQYSHDRQAQSAASSAGPVLGQAACVQGAGEQATCR
jgi:hypothetical protein